MGGNTGEIKSLLGREAVSVMAFSNGLIYMITFVFSRWKIELVCIISFVTSLDNSAHVFFGVFYIRVGGEESPGS